MKRTFSILGRIKKPITTVVALSFSMLSFGVQAQQAEPTATPTYIVPSGNGSNAADAARRAERTQLLTAAVNVGAGAMYLSVCTSSSWAGCAGCWACPLVPLAGIAASMMGRASGGSGAAGIDMSAYNPNYSTGDMPVDQWGNPITDGSSTGGVGAASNGGRLPDGTTAQSIARDVNRLNQQLEKSGVKISGNTMTLPNGRKFDLSKGGDGSMSGLMAMGLTADEASKAMEAGKKFGDQAASKYAGMLKAEGGGGGGGGGARGPTDADTGFGAFKYGDPRAKPRVAPQVSGLTKKLGDDTIGVSGDNIFDMITRRYKARDQDGNFLKD